jgi:glycosyltransferase involved in cell wall biosynthesis
MIITKGINVLAIGSDMSILEENSDSWHRMQNYGTLVNRLDIAIYNGHLVREPGSDVYQISNNVFAHPRSFLGLLGLFKVNSSKLSFVLNHKIDLVTTQDPFVFGVIGRRLAKWLRAGFHVQVHTDLMSPYFRRESFYNKLKVIAAKSVLRDATGIRVVSNRIKDSIKKFNPEVEPFVLPIWTDIEFMRSSPVKTDIKEKYPQFKKIFLMASRLTIEKNVFMAINVMVHVAKKYPNVGLVIVGSGPLKKRLEAIVNQKRLQNNVIFEEWTDDLSSYYKTCDIFINTSNYEGYGRTIVEALASGMPVITTDVGSAGDFIKKGENGFVISVGSEKELEAAMVNILSDEKLFEKIKNGAHASELKMGTLEDYLEMYARSWSEAIK